MNFPKSVSAILVLLTGCASAPPVLPPDISATPTLLQIKSDNDDNCPVWIYRTSTFYHSGNPEKPFVYVNELQVGALGVANTMCLHLPPGKYQVSIREPIMFMPGSTSGAIIVESKNSQVVFIRYSKEMAGVFVVGSSAGTTSRTSLTFSDRKSWMARD